MRILLQRFDAETGDEEEKNEESDSTTSFLTQLATWHKQELDEKLASRVQVSQRAVGKIIQVKLCKNQFALKHTHNFTRKYKCVNSKIREKIKSGHP